MQFIVIGIVVALAAAGVVLYLRRGGADGRGYRTDHHQLTKDHKAATKTRSTAINVAEKDLKAVQSFHDSAVRSIEGELVGLRSPDGRRLDYYRGVTLYELSIKTPQGRSSLVGATAAVDAAGSLAVTRRATLTRTVAGGVLLGPVGAVIGGAGFKKKKEHDNRELYLETADFVSVVTCPPDQGVKARLFAAKIQTAAKQAAHIVAQRPQQLHDAELRLDAARQDTQSIEDRQRALAQATGDPVMLAAVDASRRALEAHGTKVSVHKELPAA